MKSNAKSQCSKAGGKIDQETRLWNVGADAPSRCARRNLRHDYRYFPEPDLLPVRVSPAWRMKSQARCPSCPSETQAIRPRFRITPYDAEVLASTRALADYFEAVVRAGASSKAAANWIQVELLRQLNDAGKEITESPVPPAELAALVAKVEAVKLMPRPGRRYSPECLQTGKPAAEIIAAEGFSQISDTGENRTLVPRK